MTWNACSKSRRCFSPLLLTVTETNTHKKETKHTYVMGNRTQYLDLEDPVMVSLDKFLDFVFLPTPKLEKDKQGASPLSVITQWKDGDYVKLIGECWCRNLAMYPENDYKEG